MWTRWTERGVRHGLGHSGAWRGHAVVECSTLASRQVAATLMGVQAAEVTAGRAGLPLDLHVKVAGYGAGRFWLSLVPSARG
jgi:hypothetical protein